MRRRLNLLVLAVTSFVVVVYTVPLALLVDRRAEEAGRVEGERLVQAVAAQVVEAVAATQSSELATVAPRLALPEGVVVAGPSGEVVGSGRVPGASAGRALRTGRAATGDLPDGGWEIALPVITFADTLVVQTVVPAEVLDRGVIRAWAFLAVLGIGVNAAAVALADRLGRTLRDPVGALAAAAARIGGGDLDAPVPVPDIAELKVVAEALNRLAPQLRSLLHQEREAAADLSHRLRTPLAALRLQAEDLPDAERDQMVELVDRMQESVDRLILDVRRPGETGPEAAADLAGIAGRHAEFWAVLATEQRRSFAWSIPETRLFVAADEHEIGDVVDTLIANVFSHTEAGTGFRLGVDRDGGTVVLVVEDEGPGFLPGIDPFARGESGSGSTGLGLHIVRRIAERGGGEVAAGAASGGGARVEVRIPVVDDPDGSGHPR